MKNELEQLINYDFEKNEHKLRENDIYLSDYQVEVLNKYDIHYQNYTSMESLLFAVEDVIETSFEEAEELTMVADQIAEFNYYHFTNK